MGVRSRKPLLRGFGLHLFVAVALFAFSRVSAAQGQIFYVYDDLNRLSAVVTQQGDVAAYTYDAVGNILKIERFDVSGTAGAIAISYFAPSAGRAGTVVQVFGKGFSVTPSQTALIFNGTPATVTSAAPNRLVVSVPTGATTGPISVSTPLGSATSATPFRVLGSLSVEPPSAVLLPGRTQLFAAREDGTPTTNVLWAVNGIVGGDAGIGTITTGGLYTAPTSAAPPGIRVNALSREDPSVSASATVTTIPPGPVFSTATAVSVAVGTAGSSVNNAVTAKVSVSVLGSVGGAIAPPVSVAPVPFVGSVSPPAAARGISNLPVTLTGSGLDGATAVQFFNGATADANITVTNLTVDAQGTQITMQISIAAGASPGGRVVRVVTPAGTSTSVATGANGFTVQ
jgi:YD repeat-containing protein